MAQLKYKYLISGFTGTAPFRLEISRSAPVVSVADIIQMEDDVAQDRGWPKHNILITFWRRFEEPE